MIYTLFGSILLHILIYLPQTASNLTPPTAKNFAIFFKNICMLAQKRPSIRDQMNLSASVLNEKTPTSPLKPS